MSGLPSVVCALPNLAAHGHRREALRHVIGTEAPVPVLTDPTRELDQPLLWEMAEGENTVADYRSTGLTLGWHLLKIVRPLLRKRRLATAAKLRGYRHGQLARASGLVTHRQQPETASGVMFVTCEDETGNVNIIVWLALKE